MSTPNHTPSPESAIVKPASVPYAEGLALFIVARLALTSLISFDDLHADGNSIDSFVAIVTGAITDALPLVDPLDLAG